MKPSGRDFYERRQVCCLSFPRVFPPNAESDDQRHDKLEAMIGDSAYLVGEKPTLADGVLAGVARWLEFHEVANAERWPKLAALRRRIEKDPAVAFATAVENGERPAGSGACVGHVSLAEVIERFGA